MSISESAAPECADKARLLTLCALAAPHHQRPIKERTWIRDTLKKAGYQDLQEFPVTGRDILKDAYRAVKDAQEALGRQSPEHGC